MLVNIKNFYVLKRNLDWYRQQIFKTSTRRDKLENCILGKTCCEFTLPLHPQERREGDPCTEVKIQLKPIVVIYHTYVEPFTVVWLVNKCSETKEEEGLEEIELRSVYHPILGSTTRIRG
jgi:hypothetical protein